MITELLGRTIQYLSGTANPSQWLVDWVNGGEATSSGEHINEENALKVPAVKAAVTVLAETMATLSLDVYQTLKSGRNQPATDHPVQHILHTEPNQEISSFVWRNTTQIHLGTYGNGYALIQRTISGSKPVALWPRLPNPDRTRPYRNEQDGAIWYEMRDENGRLEEPVPARDMLHIPYFSLDGILGKSPVRMIREAIGGNKAAERFANEVFKNGATPQGFFKHPGQLSEAAYARLKASRAQQSEHGNRHKTDILEEGMEFQAVSMNPAAVQMIEVRRFLIEEIARAYRIAPHLLQDLTHGNYNNVTELGRQFIVYTMMPWCSLWAAEINRKLLKPPYFCQFNFEPFLKGDYTARAGFYRTMFGIGVYSVNDIRHKEGENPIEHPNADERFVPLNMVPLSKATEEKPAPGSQEPKPGAPPVGDGVTPAEPNGDTGGRGELAKAREAAEAVLQETLSRMERIEENAVIRATKDPAKFLSVVDAFYAKHHDTLLSAIRLQAGAVEAAGGRAYVDSTSDAIAAMDARHEMIINASECQPAELMERVQECVASWEKSQYSDQESTS